MFACEEPRPAPEAAINLLRMTISDMEINYTQGSIKAKTAIEQILEDLPSHPLCPTDGTTGYSVTRNRLSDLVGNVTAALFSSMGIVPSESTSLGHLSGPQLLRTYVQVLGFVYVYFFAVASLVMFLFAAFLLLARRHQRTLCASIGTTVHVLLGAFLASLVSFAQHFSLVYSFMTSPVILYAFTFTLLTGELLSSIGCYVTVF
ncbi:hypothetical protein EYZ11_012375 [Aspergillus tanneri]|uniref:Uncharacterized protein n=1 Tax=Aspergillus tanneri TaxID=1220188 RepID=A0A4S3J0F0_9EURO|nr:hypothetical protein EYZ11_012375 [Aspergillus tanneri]